MEILTCIDLHMQEKTICNSAIDMQAIGTRGLVFFSFLFVSFFVPGGLDSPKDANIKHVFTTASPLTTYCCRVFILE